MTWSTDRINTTIIHSLRLEQPVSFGVTSGQALDASVWYAMMDTWVCHIAIGAASRDYDLAQTPPVTFMANTDVNCRTQFKNNGTLTGLGNVGPQAISECVTLFVLQN